MACRGARPCAPTFLQMKKPLVISLLLHATLVAALLNVSVTGPARRPDRMVSLVAVQVLPHQEALESAVVVEPEPAKKERPRRRAREHPVSTAAPEPKRGNPAQKATDGFATPAGIGGGAGAMVVAVTATEAGGTGSTEAQAGPARIGGGRPAVIGGAGAATDHTEDYKAIRDAIDRVARWSYPLQARKLGVQGVVTVRFAVGPDGAARDVAVVSGSGSGLLDEAARAIVVKAGPYPLVPEPVQIPIRFSLES